MLKSMEAPLWLTFIIQCVIGAFLVAFQMVGEGIGLIAAAVVAASAAAYPVRHRLWTMVQAATLYRTTKIYFSFAYLYRIRTRSGHYLLVRHKDNAEFQPVGGVFKFHDSAELRARFNSLTVSPMKFNEPHRKQDLRGFVCGKNLPALVKWFDSKDDREVAPLREFYEELIATHVLDHSVFMYIDFRHVGTVESPIFKMDRDDLAYGAFVHEIYDLVPTPAQADALEALRGGSHSGICFVTEDDIMRLGFEPYGLQKRTAIAKHTRNAHLLEWT